VVGGFDLVGGTAVDWDERVWDEMAEMDSTSPTTSGGDCLRDVGCVCKHKGYTLVHAQRKAKRLDLPGLRA